jgi:hypothetical protein
MKTNWRAGGLRDPATMEFDVVSYGRRGPTAPRVFNREQLAQLSRTASGAPEVMVKVTGGGRDGQGVAAHFDYIGRKGELEIETDDGQLLAERHLGKRLVEDWDLDIYAKRIDRRWLTKNQIRRIPKLVHNITLSMPAKTDAQKVLAAARAFATENFALKHRYALALHTDTPHPHVHLTVKAESEEGQRLYIRKATLRQWRANFARHLREQGIDANATPRAVRWQRPSHKPDGQFRAEQRGVSTVLRQRVKGIIKDVLGGTKACDAGKEKLDQTRQEVTADWRRSLGVVLAQGEQRVALQIARFIKKMPPVQTDREALVERLQAQLQTRATSTRVPD